MTMKEAAVTQLLFSKWPVMERIQMISQSPCSSSSTRKEILYWMQSENTRQWRCSFLTKQKTEVSWKVFLYTSNFYLCYGMMWKVQEWFLLLPRGAILKAQRLFGNVIFLLDLSISFIIWKPLFESLPPYTPKLTLTSRNAVHKLDVSSTDKMIMRQYSPLDSFWTLFVMICFEVVSEIAQVFSVPYIVSVAPQWHSWYPKGKRQLL